MDQVRKANNISYALLGSGLHARAGMSPVVQLKIWNTYVIPRFIYGLEVQNPTKNDIHKIIRTIPTINVQTISMLAQPYNINRPH